MNDTSDIYFKSYDICNFIKLYRIFANYNLAIYTR